MIYEKIRPQASRIMMEVRLTAECSASNLRHSCANAYYTLVGI